MKIELRLVGNSELLNLEICGNVKYEWKRLLTIE